MKKIIILMKKGCPGEEKIRNFDDDDDDDDDNDDEDEDEDGDDDE